MDEEIEGALVAAIAAEEEANGVENVDNSAFDFDDEEVVANSVSVLEEGELVEERPRKRRRIEVERARGSGGDVEVTIDYARRGTAQTALVGRGNHASEPTSVPQTVPDTGWSFRPLDEDTTMEESSEQYGGRVDEIKEDVEDGDEGGGDERAIDPQLEDATVEIPPTTEDRDMPTRAPEPSQTRQPPDINALRPSPTATDNRGSAPMPDSRSEAIPRTVTDVQRSSRSNVHEQHVPSTPRRPGSQTSPTRTSALGGPVEAGSP